MVFYSNKAGGFGGNDLYVSTRHKLPECDERMHIKNRGW